MNSLSNIEVPTTPMSSVAPVTKRVQEPVEFPDWLMKMASRQDQLNKRYQFAHGELAKAYNEFLMLIDEINEQHGTEFSFQQVVDEYKGEFAFDANEDDDGDDDEKD